MNIEISLDTYRVHIDLSKPIDLSIKLRFSGPQPAAFGLPRAQAEPFTADEFVGDVQQGGSINCHNVALNPHGNGTHTECVGHISHERIHIADILQDTLIPAQLLTVKTERLADTGETYDAKSDADDRVITRASLKAMTAAWPSDALILRTLPNLESKREKVYTGQNPPYLTAQAMAFIRQHGVKHLLVDVPSVDREEDDGKLPNHHTFWEVPAGSNRILNVPSPNTITEMIYVPNDLRDGHGMITIQIPDFALDAAPSRVRWFGIQSIDE